MTREGVLDILRRELPTLREQYGVEELALFGSFAAGHATARSDVDLLVSFRSPPGLAFVELAERLERVLRRKVHLITRETVLREMESPRHRKIAIAIQEALVYA
jgi:predicted nucleotidyltransferase